MNSKQLGIILVLGVVLGALGYFVWKRNSASWESTGQKIGQKVLGEFPVNDVAHVTIKTADDELNLVKQDEGWTVQERSNYLANFDDISDFIYKAWDTTVLQSQKIGPSSLPRLEVVTPGEGDNSGTLVEFKNKDGKDIVSFVLGKEHMSQGSGGMGGFANGRYVLPLKDPTSVALVDETFSNARPDPDAWLNKDFVRVQEIQSVTVDHPDGDDGDFTAFKEAAGASGQLQEIDSGRTVDSSKLSRVLGVLSFPSFNDVLPADTDEATGLGDPIAARIQTFKGFEYDVKIGKPESGEDYYMTVSVSGDFPKEREAVVDESEEDKATKDQEFADDLKEREEKLAKERKLEGWIYKVSKWTVDPLLFARVDLYEEIEEEDSEASSADSDSEALETLDLNGRDSLTEDFLNPLVPTP